MFSPRRLPMLAGLVCSAAAGAQMHHVDAQEKVTRAVGVYEWTGELAKPEAARFVPISLFIDKHFEDAGLYLARPVPFALQSGDLYTVQRAGEPLGTLDLETAARVVSGNALAADNPTGAWYAYGKYVADKPPAPAAPLHKTAHPGVIQSSSGAKPETPAESGDDGRPHMTRRTPAAGTDDSGTGTGTQDTGTHDTGNSHHSTASDDDTDRPTLARRNPADDTSRRRVAGGKGDTAGVTAVGPAPGDDPDRPTLTHNTAGGKGTEELTGLPAGMHQAVAVSDAASHEPHTFSRPWEDAAERTAALAELDKAAEPAVLAYMQRNQLTPSAAPLPTSASASAEGTAANTETGAGAPPRLQRGKPVEYGSSTPTTAAAPAHKSGGQPLRSAHATARPPKAAELHLVDPELAGFTLTYGGLPTFVYTAAASAQAAGGTTPPVAVYVALVAQRLPSGQLQIALQSVTDSLHLDRTPRLRPIDAVDADGSHRASLLFELRGATSRQFALYRLVTARADNTFTSAALE